MEIMVVPFFGQGHVFPSTELCKKLSSFHFKTTFVLSSDISSSVSSTLLHHPLVNVAAVDAPVPPPPRPGKFNPQLLTLYFQQLRQGIESILTSTHNGSIVCAIIDSMILSKIEDIFAKFQVPRVAFFTSGAVWLAMDYAAYKADVEYIKPGETRFFPGLPDEMAMDYVDIVRRSHYYNSQEASDDQIIPRPKKKSFPTQPGDEPPWLEEVKNTVAILVNTFDEVEQTFLEYVAKQTGLPIWGVGPMLPENFWTLTATKTLLRDGNIRTTTTHQTNYSEDEVLQWLDSKSPSSVIYISFGSEVMPTLEEHQEIAKALEDESLGQNFIWVVSKNQDYFPDGLEAKVGKRGLVINGWAPQLLILSHPSTGGFLTHCGWNSTMEAIGQGVPVLAWPIRGDQFYNAKLIVCHLKIGHMVSYGENVGLKKVKKEEIIQGMERLMEDKEVQNRVNDVSDKFKHGFPASSAAALHDFKNFIVQAK